MEHNHGKLWQGFAIAFFMFGVGVFLAFTGGQSVETQNKLFVYVVALFVIIGGIIMLRGVFQSRDNCPICKDRYQWNRKK